MAKKGKRERVLDFLEALPLWSRLQGPSERVVLEEERRNLAAVKTRLLEILNTETLVNTGRVQIIGLQALKEKLDDKWSTHRDFIHTSLKSILQRKLSSNDVFFRHDEDDYVIVFASLGFAAAKLVCASVMQELNTLLLGKDEVRAVTVRTAIGVVEGQLLLEESSIGDVLNGLADLASEPADLEWEQDDHTSGENLEMTSNDKTSKSAALGWEPLGYKGLQGRQTVHQTWTPINEEALDEGVVPDQFELIYRPMWNPAHEIVSTFTTNFVGTDEEGQLRNAYSFVRSAKLIRSMDVNVLTRASGMASELFGLRQRFVLAIPHHYESVTNWSRLYEYAEQCKEIPEEIRNYVILSCDDFPPGVPPSKLLMIGYALKPHCRGLAGNVGWTTRDLAPYSDAGFSSVGLFVPEKTPVSVAQIRIEEFGDIARRCGLQTAVLNVHDMALCEVVRKAGIDFVMGRLIGEYQNAPSHMIRLPWSEIKNRQHRLAG